MKQRETSSLIPQKQYQLPFQDEPREFPHNKSPRSKEGIKGHIPCVSKMGTSVLAASILPPRGAVRLQWSNPAARRCQVIGQGRRNDCESITPPQDSIYVLYLVLRSWARTLNPYPRKTFGRCRHLIPRSRIHSTSALHFRQPISHLYVQLKRGEI